MTTPTIKLTPKPSYDVEINGAKLGEFMLVSSWEGFHKLTKAVGPNAGTIIVSGRAENCFSEVFNEIFGNGANPLSEAHIVKITPGLIPELPPKPSAVPTPGAE